MASEVPSVTFRTVLQGRFLGAVNDGGGAVIATATVAREWETFTLVDVNGGALQSGDSVFVRAGNGQYWQALNGGGSTLNAGSNNRLAWETFKIVKKNGVGTIVAGDVVGLQDSNGSWVSAENGGGGTVFAYGPAFGPWEGLVFGVPAMPDAGGPADTGAPADSGGSVDSGASVDSGGSPPKLFPDHGALLGAFVGTGPVADFESLVGRKIALDLKYYGWNDDIFGGNATDDIANGRIPYSTWEAWNSQVGVSLDDIAGGVHDALIRQRADEARSLAVPVLLRWAHEMNGNWYPWSGAQNGGAGVGPAKYVAAYRHIHDVFVAEGATNVQWVWCPSNADVPGDGWNHWTAYYPGDSYVDWIGFDGYNWGSTQPWGWQSFAQIFQGIYADYAASGKPLLVGETASTELGGSKADWIVGMNSAVQSAFPALKAIVWFEINKETDWRVESSPASLSAFQQVAHDPYFHP